MTAAPRHATNPLLGYGLAVACVAAVTGLGMLMAPVAGRQSPYAPMLLAVLLAAWYGGRTLALFTAALGGLATTYFILEPVASLQIQGIDQALSLAVYLACAAGIAALGGSMHVSLERAHDLNRSLEACVDERAAELLRSNELLQHSQARLASIIESANDAVITLDGRQHVVLFNRAAEVMFQRPAQAMLGQPLDLLIPPRFRSQHPSYVQDFGERRIAPRSMVASTDLVGLRANGDEFPIEASISQASSAGDMFYTAIVRDVTLQRQASQAALQLHIAQERAALAEQDSRMKSEFLASMSHELRTPLNAILGFTHLLLAGKPGPLTADQHNKLQTIKASGERQLSLIRDLLDLARIEAGRHAVSLEEVDCTLIVQHLARLQRPRAEAKELQLTVNTPGQIGTIRTDPTVLTRVVQALLDNALKFTAAGGVTLAVDQWPDEHAGVVTRIKVADTGPGIRPQDLERLFRAFGQLDGTHTREHGGLGLGLHLSNKLAGLLGAHIEVQSEFGQGSEFSLVLGGEPGGGGRP